MELSLVEAIGTLGGVVVLAVIVFLMYRRDREATEKRIIEICNGHENRLREDRMQMIQIVKDEQDTREKHTHALRELTTTLQRMNGRK